MVCHSFFNNERTYSSSLRERMGQFDPVSFSTSFLKTKNHECYCSRKWHLIALQEKHTVSEHTTEERQTEICDAFPCRARKTHRAVVNRWAAQDFELYLLFRLIIPINFPFHFLAYYFILPFCSAFALQAGPKPQAAKAQALWALEGLCVRVRSSSKVRSNKSKTKLPGTTY